MYSHLAKPHTSKIKTLRKTNLSFCIDSPRREQRIYWEEIRAKTSARCIEYFLSGTVQPPLGRKGPPVRAENGKVGEVGLSCNSFTQVPLLHTTEHTAVLSTTLQNSRVLCTSEMS